tara:strand:- start:150 stop:1421 length:1272 start_codon:yes stop_codon:yes gene_type:complete
MEREIILTPDMIRQFNLQGAMAGEVASMEDMIKMGLVDPKTNLPLLPPRDPESEEIANQSVNTVMNNTTTDNLRPLVDPNVMQRNAVASNKNMLDLLALSQQQQEPTDQFSNLSKNQRLMLAFAGIRDAGMALQGKDSNTLSNILTAFTKQADVDRKARQAQMTQQLLSGMVGPASMSATPEGMTTLDMLRARRDSILSQSFAIDPRYMPVVQGTLNELNRQIKELEQKAQKDTDTATGARTVLDTVDQLYRSIEEEGSMITGPMGMLLGNIPFTQAGEARLTIQTLKANLAFDALRGIKAGGATLGAVSAPELALLEAKVANLNLNRSKEAVLASLKEIDRYYKQLVINAYKISEDPSKLDAIFGGRPAWADGEAVDMRQFEFNRTNVPEGELIVDRDGGNKVYRYIGGPRNQASSYEEVTF